MGLASFEISKTIRHVKDFIGEQHLSLNTTNVATPHLSVVRVAGADRAAFVHNYCTADIKKLAIDQYCESFFLNHKGKTVCHGIVIAREMDLLIVSTTQTPEVLIEALDRYLISSDVQLSDATSLWSASFIFGDGANETLEAAGVSTPLGNAVHNLGFRIVLSAEIAGMGVLVLDPADGDSTLAATLVEQGANEVSAEELQKVRVEKLTPWCDFEITEQCLPQELRRDSKAISFTKGCYLGQETVARLDAMGHVNRYLVGFEVLEGTVALNEPLKKDGKKVGVATTLIDVADERAIGLGFMRVEFSSPGTELELDGGAKLKVR